MKLPFLFMKSTETTTLTPSWPWPTCGTPKTLSFRAETGKTHGFNTINDDEDIIMSPVNLELEEEGEKDSISIEKVVVRGLRSERLLFEPAATDAFTSSILDLHHQGIKIDDDDDDDGDGDGDGLIGRFKESVVMAVMDSTDPFVDFRRSMQEMVESRHGDHKDWEFLEELLTCYLRVNGKSNHGYIVGAFVDLLVGLALSSSSEYDDQYYCSSSSSSSSSCCITTNSFTSPLSFSSSTFSTTNLEVDRENSIASSSSSN